MTFEISALERRQFYGIAVLVLFRTFVLEGYFHGSCLAGDFHNVALEKFGRAALLPDDAVHHLAEDCGVFGRHHAFAHV